MSQAVDELWAVARQTPHVDAETLARAIEAAVDSEPLDYRTRLLIRDGVRALEARWGSRFQSWLEGSPHRQRIQQTVDSQFDEEEVAFPTLPRRIVDAIKPETVLEMLRELSRHVSQPTRMVIGGAIAAILRGHLVRHTEDIDIVDEIPVELRDQHDLLDDLARRYGLKLTHFQSHYLPQGWDQRLHSVDAYGKLHVFSVDIYDVFVGKLFSTRIKDRDDLRALKPRLNPQAILDRLRESSAPLRGEMRMLEAARENWFILYGEPLPE